MCILCAHNCVQRAHKHVVIEIKSSVWVASIEILGQIFPSICNTASGPMAPELIPLSVNPIIDIQLVFNFDQSWEFTRVSQVTAALSWTIFGIAPSVCIIVLVDAVFQSVYSINIWQSGQQWSKCRNYHLGGARMMVASCQLPMNTSHSYIPGHE